MMTKLQEWMSHPERLNRDTLYELRTLLARYPYFQTARILYIKNLYLLHDSAFGDELRKAALYVADRRVLFYLIEGGRFVVRPQKAEKPLGEEPGLDRTLCLIDAFLASVPEEKPQATGSDALTTDYMAYMLREEELPEREDAEPAAPLRGQDLIDEFIEKADERLAVHDAPEPEEPLLPEPDGRAEESPGGEAGDGEDDGYFTETLAKIYVKQKRYEKALEIIKKLSLKYPKKNAYFADQIRFLEKLIINTKSN